MSNYQSNNPQQTERQRERWSQQQRGQQDSSDNPSDYDLYDQQQEARYAWNHDPDYHDIDNPSYGRDFDAQSNGRQNTNVASGNEEPSYQQKRYAQHGDGFGFAKHAHRDTAEYRGRPGHSTWGQGSGEEIRNANREPSRDWSGERSGQLGGQSRESSREQGYYPDYDAVNPARGYRGANADRQWDNSRRSGNDRGRISYADHWPPNGYQTNQPNGASPRWQNNPSYPHQDSHRGAYGLQVDQPTDYSMGRDSSGDRFYNADRYNADSHFNADRDRANDRNYRFAQGSSSPGGYNQGHRGRGPKGYERSDERVREDICERLALDPHVDASEITVSVKSGVVTLEGSIDERVQKHRAEDIADSCSGVKDVQNRLNVSPRNQRGSYSASAPTSATSQSTSQSASQPTAQSPSLEEQGRSLENNESKAMAQQKPTRQ